MSGPNDDDLRAQLQATLGTVLGSDLEAHIRRDAVVLVDDALDLVTAGLAIAKDDAASVGAWLARGLVRRPTDEERARWLAAPERPWRAAVVQPFVLVQALS